MKEDMEVMGPVKVRDVDEAQLKIVVVAKGLADKGEIILSSGEDGQDEFIS
jgi:flagellar motor switch protein FliG